MTKNSVGSDSQVKKANQKKPILQTIYSKLTRVIYSKNHSFHIKPKEANITNHLFKVN